MSLVNYQSKEITYKLVYYGCGLGGKTTCLQHIHAQLAPESRGDLVTLATETERTLFFDFLPIDFGTVSDFKVRVALYTVPGQPQYNRSRQLILQGVDAIIFVADSGPDRVEDNIASLLNMIENLATHRLKIDQVPWVFQYNKRDLADALPLEEMEELLNSTYKVPSFESIALEGKGVFSTLKAALKLAINKGAAAGKGKDNPLIK
jgi:signal recognition particle receptor subunit beta